MGFIHRINSANFVAETSFDANVWSSRYSVNSVLCYSRLLSLTTWKLSPFLNRRFGPPDIMKIIFLTWKIGLFFQHNTWIFHLHATSQQASHLSTRCLGLPFLAPVSVRPSFYLCYHVVHSSKAQSAELFNSCSGIGRA